MESDPIPDDDNPVSSDDQKDGVLPLNPLHAAAIVGGVVAAGAGAYLGARALARRNAREGKVNSVLATAITASEVSHKPEEREADEGQE